MRPGARPPTRRLLLCGAVAGPLFLLVVLLQDYGRPGVDPRAQPLSLLALGSLGWLQVLNFIGAGVLSLGYADPAHGFPPGVGEPARLSWHGALHDVGGLVVFVSLAGALVAFALRFRRRRERWWALYALLIRAAEGQQAELVWVSRARRQGRLL